MKNITKNKLLKLGFGEDEAGGEECMEIGLEKGSDRFYHFLRWYDDEPERFYIDCLYTNGVKTISEEDFLRNHNGLSTNAVNCYLKIIDKLESWGNDSN